ncbi:hypothetical protein QUF76_10155 [Desulfobacterales bacterium HSG16]|nr:hypothetical protein [Desulfobacterales bacterium HSG16]
MEKNVENIQKIWGFALLIMGIALIIRIPAGMVRFEKIESMSHMLPYIRFCFYLIGIMLTGGGLKKIYTFVFQAKKQETEDHNTNRQQVE